LADQAALALHQAARQEALSQRYEATTAELKHTRTVLEEKNRDLEWKYSYRNIIGRKSPAMRKVFDLLDRMASTDASVLIEGESGTGKELIAQAIHYNSPRKDKPFVAINCAGLSPTLLESDLFGHRKGAFTGADENRDGLFTIANGGTMFFDEIADMPLAVQAKLLRTLQEGEIRPLGTNRTIHVDVRIISASNQPLEGRVTAGQFRQDFYYRLNVVKLELPALRDRPEDFDDLVDYFLAEFSKNRSSPVTLSAAIRRTLRAYTWPGNLRELRNTLENLVATAGTRKISEENLPDHIRFHSNLVSAKTLEFHAAKEEFIREYLRKVLHQAQGNVAQAARVAGVVRQSFYRMLQRYGIVD
jgi:two-component system response regulator HydG